MGKKNTIRVLSILLALVFVLGLGACNRNPEESSAAPSRPSVSSRPDIDPEDLYYPVDLPDYADLIADAQEINEEVVGWMRIPGTELDEYVLCKQDPADMNKYYERKDIYLNYAMEGVLYADCRLTFDKGTADELARNTTVYGHALDMDENPDGVKFGQLKKFWDPEFAKANPYVYFSTENEDMVWEIMAAFYTTTNHDYIDPMEGWTREQVQHAIDEAKARSLYNYDVEVSPDDKFLSLSTCVYDIAGGVYPNKYRFVIMAKLVDDGIYYKEARMTVNPSPLEADDKFEG